MIQTIHKLSNQFACGPVPEGQDFDQLRRQGFNTMIDLRTRREMGDVELGEQARIVRNHGLEYFHLSVDSPTPQPALVEELRNRLPTMPGPYYAYPGERGGVMLVLHILLEERVEGQRAIDRALELGFEPQSDRVRGFIKEYVDQHPIRPF